MVGTHAFKFKAARAGSPTGTGAPLRVAVAAVRPP